ncbi:hypothetical protein [Schumannella sp. 10F1B-5-1]|uniref:hypothetical protein n=1 Tax=Schumannella sp. 10F1B-5-1 TaxID=2590780 RepID=UPI0011320358|nr:hypothetical protein [Schumannella sp. 10F1B-5-1]TPW71643.1 hypothetical protein FJ658_09830 [Schumannella sp. 10F1B-5-1]
MAFLIEHPADWIGVPERWPFPRPDGGEIADAAQWAEELVEELDIENDLRRAERVVVRELARAAAELAERRGSRTFIAFHGFDAGFVAAAEVHSGPEIAAAELAELVVAGSPASVGRDDVAPFTTSSGVVGMRAYRYLPLAAATADTATSSADLAGAPADAVIGRADYVLRAGDTALWLTAAEVDLVWFERVKPRLEALAASVTWR